MIDVVASQVRVDHAEQAVDVDSRADRDPVTPTAVSGDTEGDGLLDADCDGCPVNRYPPSDAVEADDLAGEVVHHTDAEKTAIELVADGGRRGVIAGEESARAPNLIDMAVMGESLMEALAQVPKDAVVHGPNLRHCRSGESGPTGCEKGIRVDGTPAVSSAPVGIRTPNLLIRSKPKGSS